MLIQAQPRKGACSLLRNSSGRHGSGARAWRAHGPGSARGSKWDRIPWWKIFVVQWELLMDVHSLFGVQELWLPKRLREWLFGLLSACHTYLELARPCHSVCAFRAGCCPVLSTPSPVSTLSPPGLQADWIAWVCLHLEEYRRLAKFIPASGRWYLYDINMNSPHQFVQKMQRVLARILRMEGHIFCAWDFSILTWEEFVFHLIWGPDSFLVWTWKSSFCRDRKLHTSFKEFFKSNGIYIWGGNEGLGIKWDILEKIIS